MSVSNPLKGSLHSSRQVPSTVAPFPTISSATTVVVVPFTPQTTDITPTTESSHQTSTTTDDDVELIRLSPSNPPPPGASSSSVQVVIGNPTVAYSDVDGTPSSGDGDLLEKAADKPPLPSWVEHMFLGEARAVRDCYWDSVSDTVKGGAGADHFITACAIADIALRGVGEVVFIDNTWSSILMWLCLLIQDWYSTLMVSLFLLLLSVVTVLYPVFPRALVGKSLYLYNTVLATIAMAIFAHQSGNPDPITGVNFLSICIGNAICFLLVCYFRMSDTLAPFCATFPFNIASIVFLIAGNGIAFSTLNFTGSVIRVDPLSLMGTTAMTSSTNVTHAEAILLSIPNGFGQVFFVDIWPLGLIMLLSCGLHSPTLMVFATLGSLSGALFAWAFDANLIDIATGLWGFNPVLLAMLVGLTWTRSHNQHWLRWHIERFVVAMFLCLMTVVITSLERYLFSSKLGVSAFTMPFCTVGVLYITVLTSPIVTRHNNS